MVLKIVVGLLVGSCLAVFVARVRSSCMRRLRSVDGSRGPPSGKLLNGPQVTRLGSRRLSPGWRQAEPDTAAVASEASSITALVVDDGSSDADNLAKVIVHITAHVETHARLGWQRYPEDL